MNSIGNPLVLLHPSITLALTPSDLPCVTGNEGVEKEWDKQSLLSWDLDLDIKIYGFCFFIPSPGRMGVFWLQENYAWSLGMKLQLLFHSVFAKCDVAEQLSIPIGEERRKSQIRQSGKKIPVMQSESSYLMCNNVRIYSGLRD